MSYWIGFVGGSGYVCLVVFFFNFINWWKPDTYPNVFGMIIGLILIIMSRILYKKNNDAKSKQTEDKE